MLHQADLLRQGVYSYVILHIMLKLSAALLDQPIMSLRTGAAVGASQAAIINPNNLKIEGFYSSDRFSKDRLVLLTQDIRDITKQGMIVDDHDVLTKPDELIRLKSILELDFTLIDKPVYTVSKHKVGKITDYAADEATLYIQKIYVGQSLIKSLSTGQLSIDRTQIVEITNRRVVIKDLEQSVKGGIPATAPAI